MPASHLPLHVVDSPFIDLGPGLETLGPGTTGNVRPLEMILGPRQYFVKGDRTPPVFYWRFLVSYKNWLWDQDNHFVKGDRTPPVLYWRRLANYKKMT